MKKISIYIDLAFCIIVLPIMMLLFPIERWFHNFQWYIISVTVWLYALYILNRLFTIPLLFKGSRKAIYGVIIISGSFAITYFLSGITLYTPKPNIHDFGIYQLFPHIQHYQQAVWSLFMIVETFSFAVGLLTQTNIQRSRRREVEAERDKALIALYRAQIKPHFLFNTLNSIYGLFLTKNKNALESLERFISMIRYVYTSTLRDKIPLSEELDYIKEYVALQALRLNEMTKVSLDIEISDQSLMIPPMLLVTFVENCFKHGVSSVEHGKILITIHESNGKILFMTDNRIFGSASAAKDNPTGIANCRKRLSLLYPEKHSLEILEDKKCFIVKLNIDLS